MGSSQAEAHLLPSQGQGGNFPADLPGSGPAATGPLKAAHAGVVEGLALPFCSLRMSALARVKPSTFIWAILMLFLAVLKSLESQCTWLSFYFFFFLILDLKSVACWARLSEGFPWKGQFSPTRPGGFTTFGRRFDAVWFRVVFISDNIMWWNAEISRGSKNNSTYGGDHGKVQHLPRHYLVLNQIIKKKRITKQRQINIHIKRVLNQISKKETNNKIEKN